MAAVRTKRIPNTEDAGQRSESIASAIARNVAFETGAAEVAAFVLFRLRKCLKHREYQKNFRIPWPCAQDFTERACHIQQINNSLMPYGLGGGW